MDVARLRLRAIAGVGRVGNGVYERLAGRPDAPVWLRASA